MSWIPKSLMEMGGGPAPAGDAGAGSGAAPGADPSQAPGMSGIPGDGYFDPGTQRVHLPDLTPEELAQMGPSQPASFKFKYGDQEFTSQEALSQYIQGLQKAPAAAAPQPDDIEARIAQALEQQREKSEQIWYERMSQLAAGGGQQPSRGTSPEATPQNPWDAETHPKEHYNWETKQAVESATAPLLERLEAMEEQFGASSERLENERGISQFEGLFSQAAKAEGVDPDWAEDVKALVIRRDKVDTSTWHNVGAEVAAVWRAMKSRMDKQVENGVSELMKKGKKFPPSVLRDASAPMGTGGGMKREPVRSLTGKDSTFHAARREMSRLPQE